MRQLAPQARQSVNLPLRVLVVEDHADVAQMFGVLLRCWGHEVRISRTGLEGLAEARRWSPDVVLCDIGLPGLDGWSVARELRQDARTARIRLYAVTAYGSEADIRRSQEAGFDGHLVKPVDLEVLKEAVVGCGSPLV